MKYTLDRFEGDFAVLVDSNGKIKNLSASEVSDAKEGDTVVLENDKYSVDKQDTENRKDRIESLKNKLFK